jgi:hypothetical protein
MFRLSQYSCVCVTAVVLLGPAARMVFADCPPCYAAGAFPNVPLRGHGQAPDGHRRELYYQIDAESFTDTGGQIIPDFNTAVTNAVAAWNSKDTCYFLDTPGPPVDIFIQYSTNMRSPDGKIACGDNNFPDGSPVHVIRVNWPFMADRLNGQALINAAASTIEHEIGHSFGLADAASGCGASVMQDAAINCAPTASGASISQSDVNASNANCCRADPSGNCSQYQQCTSKSIRRTEEQECDCTSSTGNHFSGTVNDSGSCDCTCDPCGYPGGEDPSCDSGLCGSNGCCVLSCGDAAECPGGAYDCPGTTCVDGCCTSQCIDLACSGTDYCQANHGGNYEWVCIDPPNGCCVFDPTPGSHCGVCGTIAVDKHTCIDPCACASGANCFHGGCPRNSQMSCNLTTFCCESGCPLPDQFGRCSIPNAFVNGQTGCCQQFGNVPCMMYCDANVPDACGGGEICIDGCCGCVENYGHACGDCDWGGWGTTQCDGSCYTNPVDVGCACDMNERCGYCGSFVCDGECNDPCPHYPGNPCGGCGTYDGDGVACNDPCNGCSPNINDSCGNCGSIQCSGSCDDPCACVPNVNSGCGGTCGTVQCDGSCYDPCAPTCVSYAGEGCGGSNCINSDCWSCGTYDCQGDCQLTPSCCAPWAGSSCGYCGTSQCDGSCSDSCAG